MIRKWWPYVEWVGRGEKEGVRTLHAEGSRRTDGGNLERMRGNFQQRKDGSYSGGQLELPHWGNVTFTQGVEPAIGITDYGMDVVIW